MFENIQGPLPYFTATVGMVKENGEYALCQVRIKTRGAGIKNFSRNSSCDEAWMEFEDFLTEPQKLLRSIQGAADMQILFMRRPGGVMDPKKEGRPSDEEFGKWKMQLITVAFDEHTLNLDDVVDTYDRYVGNRYPRQIEQALEYVRKNFH